MLAELINNIEKALISYMKMLEGDRLRDQYAQGMLGIVIQCRSVTDTRKRDIQALYAICQSAHQSLEEPIDCIRRLVAYLNTIQVGFFFFRNQSKLRHCILHAINMYDPRYILNAKAHPIQLDEAAMNRPIQLSLAPSLVPSLRVDDPQAKISPALQQQFDAMKQAMQKQQEDLEMQRLLTQQLRESLLEMSSGIDERERVIIALKGELVQLRGELPRVKQHHKGTTDAVPVQASAGVNAASVSIHRRMGLVSS